MAAVEVDEKSAAGTEIEGSVDIVAVKVPQEEGAVAGTKAVGIAGLGFHEIEEVLGSTVLAEEQKGFGYEGID